LIHVSVFKVPGPHFVNSYNPELILLNDWYISAATKGSTVLQRCSVVFSPQGTEKLSGLISVLDAYVLSLNHITPFPSLSLHAYVPYELH